jgi:hypothetical protein
MDEKMMRIINSNKTENHFSAAVLSRDKQRGGVSDVAMNALMIGSTEAFSKKILAS